MISTLKKHEKTETIQGPVGELEVVLADPIGERRGAWGIVCHPHPLYGGNMQNKVVTTLVKTFQHLGLNAVRFNFRGVGKSQGQYDQGNGELLDLLAVIEWVQAERKQDIWLAGFSFGAYIAAKAAIEISAKKLVLVAPPVQHFPMQILPPFPCPWILVQGERDDVVPPEAVFAWAEARQPQPTVLRFPNAGHFFHGELGEMRAQLEAVLS